jgi:biopolymer transport protein ExbB
MAQSDLPAASGIATRLLPKDLSLGAMFTNADIVVQAVLVGLVFASVVTWTILLAKGASFLSARRSVQRALQDAETERTLAGLKLRLQGPAAGRIQQAMLAAATKELQLSTDHDSAGIKERIASRLHRLEVSAGRQMARGTGLLATIGATAPFVGLFGTVWGIMNSFIGISQSQTTNLAVVAPGIAEALLATATGLVAAIPAVVIYNVFARGIGSYRATLADLSAAILRLVSRELDHRGSVRAAAAE